MRSMRVIKQAGIYFEYLGMYYDYYINDCCCCSFLPTTESWQAPDIRGSPCALGSGSPAILRPQNHAERQDGWRVCVLRVFPPGHASKDLVQHRP